MLSPHYYHQDGTRDGSRGNRLRCLSDHRTRRRKRRRRLHPSLQRKRGTSGREPGSHSTHLRPDSLCNRDTGSRAGSDRREASRAAHHHAGRHRCSTRGGGVMQTLLDILKRAGGWNPGLYLKIENAPYMALVIEATDESGPSGLPAISVAHYGEQNGDLMRDPEMCFELGFAEGPHLEPFYFRNDYLGIEQWSRTIERSHYVHLSGLHATQAIRQAVGQQPPFAGLRRSLRAAADPTRLNPFRSGADTAHRVCPTPQTYQPAQG